MNHRGAPRQDPGAAMPRAPLAPPRRLRAADQGPLDWLVPFIPPFLRVNRETREMLWSTIIEATSTEAVQRTAARITGFLRDHRAAFTNCSIISVLWIAGLLWVHRNVPEFGTSYVIISGFVALFLHSRGGDGSANSDGENLSAYSVFNKGGRRMMGSLSAEQFENEIRHRGPRGVDDSDGDAVIDRDSMSEEEEDPDMLEAIRQSLQEKKREERRMRRTRRR